MASALWRPRGFAPCAGHSVTLYEKSSELGGVFIAAAVPSFKEKDKVLIKWYKKQIADLNVDIRLHTEISSEEILKLGTDEIIVATGAKPCQLPIEGIQRENVMEAFEYLCGTKSAGDTVAIVGGGMTGCEIAYVLILKI